jgi:putative transposase
MDSMKYCMANKGLIVYSYVIMPNHIHCIWQAKNSNLSDVIRDFKKHTSNEIIKSINANEESRKDWLKIVFEYHANFGCIPFLHRNQFKIPFVTFRVRVKQKEF